MHPETKSNDFIHNSTVALKDITLQTALDRATNRAVNGRIIAMSETTDAPALRQQARHARLRALHNLPELLERLEANLKARGITVLWAADGAECNQQVIDIAHRHGAKKMIKSKSI